MTISSNMNQNSNLKSGEQFERFFNLHPDALSITQIRNGKIVEVNNGYLKLIGYQRDEVIGETTLDINIWDNVNDRKELFNKLVKEKTVKDFEATFIRKDGSKFYGLITASIVDLENEPHVISITRDITESKLLEKKLTNNEQLLKETQQIAGLGTYVLDISENRWTSSEVLDSIFGIDESPDVPSMPVLLPSSSL